MTVFASDWKVGLGLALGLLLVSPGHALAGALGLVCAHVGAKLARTPADLVRAGLGELNGWFAGIAVFSCFAGTVPIILLTIAVGGLSGVGVALVKRVLAPWDLPVLVAGYLAPVWVAFAALGGVYGRALPEVSALSELGPLAAWSQGALRGLGEIFFVPDARLGLVFLAALAWTFRRQALFAAGAAVLGVAVADLAGAPAWFTQQGLGAFVPALVAAAAAKRCQGFGWGLVAAAVVLGPFVEWAAISVAGRLGLPALSIGYLGFVWIAVCVKPVAHDGMAWKPMPDYQKDSSFI